MRRLGEEGKQKKQLVREERMSERSCAMVWDGVSTEGRRCREAGGS